MNTRATVTLLVVAAALGGYYYLGEVRGGAKRAASKQQAERLFPVPDSAVSGFRTVRAGETLLVRRAASGWDLVRPVDSGADAGSVDAAVGSIVEARREETLEGAGLDPAHYGLRPPSLELSVTAAGATRTLHLGDYNPTQSFVYAAWPDSARIMLVSASVRRALDKGALEFRDRSVMAVDAAGVKRIVIRRDGLPSDLAFEQADGRWRAASPRSFRADKVTVETLLGSLGSTRVVDFVDEHPVDLAPFGLDRPSLTLRVETGEDASARVLLIGAKDEARGAWYARREGKPAVFLLPDDNLMTSLRKEPAEFRAPTVVEYEQSEVERVVFAAGDSTWTIEKRTVAGDEPGPGYEWTRREDGAKYDASRMNDLLWEVKRLRWSEVIAESAPGDRAGYGLAPAARSVTLYGAGGREVARLLLGGPRTGSDEIFAMNGSEPVLYAVPSGAATTIPASLAGYSELRQTADAGKAPVPPAGAGSK